MSTPDSDNSKFTAKTQRLYTDVEFLTGLRPFRNYRNTESLEKTCDYLRQEFTAAGYKTLDQKWTASAVEYTNVIASYNPEKKKRFIVGAHYDVAGEQPGADDNASAVAGLLETARLVAENKSQLDYRIDFVAYCLEEPPFFGTEQMGSYVHAKSLHDADVDVLGMICYEMIGYFSDVPGSQNFPNEQLARLYPHTGNFILVVGVDVHLDFNTKVYELMKPGSKVQVLPANLPPARGLAGLSDQRSYWKFGYPALMINDSSFLRNPNYHKISDTIDTLDFEKMTEVINSSYKAVTGF